MGDIVHRPEGGARLRLSVAAAGPIQRIDLFRGVEHLETVRPYADTEAGNRIAVIWEGAEYRGRFRAVRWDGSAEFDGTEIEAVAAVNFFSRDKTLDRTGRAGLAWKSVTTGNQAGFIASLRDAFAGSLKLKTPLIEATVPLAEIGVADRVLDASGELPRRMRLFRLPNTNLHREFTLERELVPAGSGDSPFYVRVTLEDGTQAWTSPVYILRHV